MTKTAIKDQLFGKVVERLCAMEGVACETQAEGRIGLRITHNGASGETSLELRAGNYGARKNQYGRLRETLRELGITEGLVFVPEKPPRRPMTPPMRAAREKRKKDFDAWQDVWRTIRRAEKALDVEYEIAQMRDYY